MNLLVRKNPGGQSDPLTPMDQNFATLDDLSNTIDYSSTEFKNKFYHWWRWYTIKDSMM